MLARPHALRSRQAWRIHDFPMKNLNLVYGSKPLNRAVRNSRFEASIQDSKQIYSRSPYETGMKIDFLQVLPRAPAPVDQPGLQ